MPNWDSGRVELTDNARFLIFVKNVAKILYAVVKTFTKILAKLTFGLLQKRENLSEPENISMTWDFGGFSESILVFASDFREHCWKFVLEIKFVRTYFSKTVSAKIFVIYEAIEI